MAHRRLATLDLTDDVSKQCHRNGLKTVQDVLQLSLLDMMKKLCLSCDQSRALQLQLYHHCTPAHTTAWQLLQQEQQSTLGLGHDALDQLLGGGLQRAAITEMTGPAGVGKTQWCLEVAVRCLLRDRDSITPVIYIDTEAAFTPQRVVEMLGGRLEASQQHLIPELLSKLIVHQPSTVSSLEKIVNQLEVEAAESGAGVVIVDSIASLARKEFPPHASDGGAWRRVLVLAGWAARLKTLAANRQLVVLVTNQVTSRTLACETAAAGAMGAGHATRDADGDTGRSYHDEEDEDGDDITDREKCVQYRQFVTPALGNTWTHFVNTRLILQYTADTATRQLLIAKSPVSPFASFSYNIDASGVHIQGEGCYSYSGSDPGLHRIRVEPGLRF